MWRSDDVSVLVTWNDALVVESVYWRRLLVAQLMERLLLMSLIFVAMNLGDCHFVQETISLSDQCVLIAAVVAMSDLWNIKRNQFKKEIWQLFSNIKNLRI